MRTARAFARVVTASVLVVIAAVACTNPPGPPPGSTTTTTGPTPPPGALLLEYTATGGLCPQDQCGTEVTVYRSGAYHASIGVREVDGQFNADETADLIRRIETQRGTLANLAPAPALCPAAYDGSNITVTVHAGGPAVTVTNCDPRDPSRNRQIPGDNPLLLHIGQLVQRLSAPLPNPDRRLVEWHESGGHCREACPVVRATITSDGRWTATSGPTSTTGELGAAATADLTRRIRAGAAGLASLPPSSGCPSAYDGRDIVITYRLDGRTVRVSNCERDFTGNALIDHTAALVAGFV